MNQISMLNKPNYQNLTYSQDTQSSMIEAGRNPDFENIMKI